MINLEAGLSTDISSPARGGQNSTLHICQPRSPHHITSSVMLWGPCRPACDVGAALHRASAEEAEHDGPNPASAASKGTSPASMPVRTPTPQAQSGLPRTNPSPASMPAPAPPQSHLERDQACPGPRPAPSSCQHPPPPTPTLSAIRPAQNQPQPSQPASTHYHHTHSHPLSPSPTLSAIRSSRNRLSEGSGRSLRRMVCTAEEAQSQTRWLRMPETPRSHSTWDSQLPCTLSTALSPSRRSPRICAQQQEALCLLRGSLVPYDALATQAASCKESVRNSSARRMGQQFAGGMAV